MKHKTVFEKFESFNINEAMYKGDKEWKFKGDYVHIKMTEAEAKAAAKNPSTKNGKYDMVILDEINVAVDFNLIGLNDVIKQL